MAIALTVFGVVLAIILGTYWVAVVRPESGERESIQKRLRRPRSVRLLAKLEKQQEKLSGGGSVDSVLARFEGLSTPLQRIILQSGIDMSVGGLVLASLFGLAGVGWAVYGVGAALDRGMSTGGAERRRWLLAAVAVVVAAHSYGTVRLARAPRPSPAAGC